METRIEDITPLMKTQQYNAIAIYGMGGIGKTTLAQCIYNLNKHAFERSSFVEKIGEKYKHDSLRLQEELLRDISGKKNIEISNALEGTSKIEEVLQTKKVLIVLDDIDDQEELNTLLGTKPFHAESKIVLTTRLRHIDAWFASKSPRCKMHELISLNDDESLELFSWHAFPSKILMEGFEQLAKQLVQYCGGNPLALRVLGSSLLFSDEDPCKRKDIIKSWRDRMNSLNSSKGDLDSPTEEVLRKSFDSLPLARHKKLFLHIACFFVGEYEEHVISILHDDFYAKSGVMILVNKCLLTVSDSGHFVMHQLLQEMGRKIVCEQSEDPAKRSSVWDDESYHVLEKGNGSVTIEGLSLDMEKVKQKTTNLQTSSLAKLDKLKLLQLKYVKLTGSYKNFPELRWLCWHGCSLKTMRPGLLKSSLVAIDMSYGQMKTFEAPTILNSLKILTLEGCAKLVTIRKLRRLPKLETLILCSCSSLTHLSESIEDLKSLVVLDLNGCNKLLKAFWKNVKSRIGGNSGQPFFPLPCSLKSLYMNNCDIKCDADVQVAFHAQSFFNVHLECNPFKFLPTSINLKMLQTLNLYSCSSLKSLPCIPSTLEELYIDWCCSLEKITFQSGCFNLQQFSYEGCSQLFEVQGLFKLVPIAKIDVPDLVEPMQWIKTYEHHKVDLIGDEINEGRLPPIQMLYEYEVMSTYLQGIKDQSMMTSDYRSPSGLLSFCVPSNQKKRRIQGLHVSCLYRSLGSKRNNMWVLLAKISNKTKGLTWVYNPMIYCNPCVDEDAVWLSYWPIGYILDAGDVVHVEIIVDECVMTVSKCGASLVYTDRDVEQEERCENKMIKGGEVIEGDLSEFKVTKGGYYLCRRDLFGSETSSRLKKLFDDKVDYPEFQGWKKSRQSKMRSYKTGLRTFRDNVELPRDLFEPEIETTIIQSRASIVILSQGYAKSSWCLEELCMILEQRRKCGHFVVPVFYNVDPSYVRKQFEDCSGTMSKWKAAISEVTSLSGMVVSGSRVDFIKTVVSTIKHELELRKTSNE